MACGSPWMMKFVSAMAILYLLGALCTSVYSFTSTIWMEYTVQSSDSYTVSNMAYYTRTRGMLFECPKSESAEVLKDRTYVPVLFTNCRYLELDEQKGGNYSQNVIINLRRAHIGVFWAAIAIVLFTTIYYVIALLCFQYKYAKLGVQHLLKHQIVATILIFFGATVFFISFVVFHILMDREKVSEAPQLRSIYYNWPPNIKSTTTIKYGLSYWMAWVATGLTVLAGFFIIFTLVCCYKPKDSADSRIKMEYENTGFYNVSHDPRRENHYEDVVVKSSPHSDSFNMGRSTPHLAIDNDEKVLIPVYYDNTYDSLHGGSAHMKPARKPDAFYAIPSSVSGRESGIHIGRPGSTANSVY